MIGAVSMEEPKRMKEFAGKRTIVSSSYYPALLRNNVQLIPHGVARLTETGVVDTTGVETPVDVLIMATGYEPTNALKGLNIKGRSGKSWGRCGATSRGPIAASPRTCLRPHRP
jgi:cation diffusion facilitator CzcD-associated flavoprotein CzcO